MNIIEKMREHKITLPPFNNAVANYSPAVISGNLIFTAGQTTRFAGKMQQVGIVNDDNIELGYQAAETCVLNCLGIIDALGGGLENVERIVKITGYVFCEQSFKNQAKVLDGATDLLVKIFGDKGRPARTTVGVSSLPGGSMCEIEMIAELKDRNKCITE